LISPENYFETVVDEERFNKYKKVNNKAEMKLQIKQASKKAKKLKMDPASVKTTADIVEENQEDQAKPGQSSNLTIDELRSRLHSRIESIVSRRGGTKKERAPVETKKTPKVAKMKLNIPSTKLEPSKAASSPPINENGQVMFSKFDFGDSKKRKQQSDPLSTLRKLEAKRQKIDTLQQTNPEKAQSVVQKEEWKKAFEKIEGVKVKDDVSLLKKTIKKKEKQKEKSAKEWIERKKQVQESIEQKQIKRRNNIQKRKQENKQRKMGIKVQKKRPGFEGTKRK
jgi:hypothetical protein